MSGFFLMNDDSIRYSYDAWLTPFKPSDVLGIVQRIQVRLDVINIAFIVIRFECLFITHFCAFTSDINTHQTKQSDWTYQLLTCAVNLQMDSSDNMIDIGIDVIISLTDIGSSTTLDMSRSISYLPCLFSSSQSPCTIRQVAMALQLNLIIWY